VHRKGVLRAAATSLGSGWNAGFLTEDDWMEVDEVALLGATSLVWNDDCWSVLRPGANWRMLRSGSRWPDPLTELCVVFAFGHFNAVVPAGWTKPAVEAPVGLGNDVKHELRDWLGEASVLWEATGGGLCAAESVATSRMGLGVPRAAAGSGNYVRSVRKRKARAVQILEPVVDEGLSAEETRLVDAALVANPSNQNEQLSDCVTRKEARTVRAEKWFSDAIVGAFGRHLEQCARERMRALSVQSERMRAKLRLHVMTPFFYDKLMQVQRPAYTCEDPGDGKRRKLAQGSVEQYTIGCYKYDEVQRWHRPLIMKGRHDVDSLFDMAVLLVPVNVNGNHWCVARIDVARRRIEWRDSLGGNGRDELRVLEQWLVDQASEENLPSRQWETVVVSCPQQGNGFDCGPFSCLAMESLSQLSAVDSSLPVLNYSQADIPAARRRILCRALQVVGD